MQEQEQEKRPYKIMLGDVVTVARNDYNGHTFYKIYFRKKVQDETTIEGTKNIRFKGDVDIEDGTKIRILDMFEDFYNKDRFNTIWTLVIMDYEIVETEKAIEEYNETMANMDDDLPF
jgi:hypothetical protein